jgi:hypothetical protein
VVRRTSGAVAALALGAACAPTFSDVTPIVTAPRLLAVRATPAEAALGASFTLSALYVGPDAAAAPSSLDWATCLLQTPQGQPDPVNAACFVPSSPDLVPLGTGGSVTATMPQSACQLFGPDVPPPAPGQPSPRPTDPDATGGFYLPVRIEVSADAWAVAEERIACAPSGVTQQVFAAYMAGYVPNENPTVASLASVPAGGGAATAMPPDGDGAAPFEVHAGQELSLEVAWPGCPSNPASCEGAETFLVIDPATLTLVTQRESMVASWYATAGSFALDRSGRAGTDAATSASNRWTAPGSEGTVHLWVVLRDARGGVGWQSYTIAVGP